MARDTAVSAEDLVAAVRSHKAKGVLLIFDYFDTFKQLDLGQFADSYFDTDEEVPDVACLAAVRPGGLQRAQDISQGWFEEISLRQDEPYQEAITHAIIAKVARSAKERFGLPALTEICGTRPIIALLIAQQIEASMPLSDPELAGLRRNPGLLVWLHRWTREDFRSDDDEWPDGLASARVRLLASTVAATACSQARTSVESAVGSFLAGERADRQATPRGVVGWLTQLGWLLDDHAGGLEIVHDIVIDQLLKAALIPNGMLLENVARSLLSALVVDTRTFHRAVSHIARWSAELKPRHQEEFEEICARWLSEIPDDVVRLLTDANDLDEGIQTLLAMVAGSPWQVGIVSNWAVIVEPWLDQVSSVSPRIAHETFASVIRALSGDLPEPLIATALTWLDGHHTDRAAFSVLGRVLHAAKFTEWADAVACHALSWLDQYPGPDSWGTSFVLAGLFAARGLRPGTMAEVIRRASTWVSNGIRAPSASYVLRQWLENDTLDDDDAEKGIVLSFAWLARAPGTRPDLTFVLRPLLRNPRVRGEQLAKTVEITLTWLEGNGTRDMAAPLLRAFLERKDAGRRSTARRLALDWLESHCEENAAKSLLCAVLEEPGLDEAERIRAVSYAHAWLKTPLGKIPDASFVLEAVFGRLNEDDEEHPEILDVAFRWLEKHRASDRFTFVLAPFLAATPDIDPGSGRHERAVDRAVEWLADNLVQDGASFVLESLCSPPYLEEGAKYARIIPDRAVAWLRTRPDEIKVFRVALPLIRFAKVDPAQRNVVVAAALRSLDAYPEYRTATDLFFTLAKWTALSPESVGAIVDCGLLRLDGADNRTARGILTILLRRRDIPVPQAEALADKAFAWLDGRATKSRSGSVILGLTGQRRLDETRNRTVADLALAWLQVHGTTGYARQILDGLAGLPDLDPPRRSRIQAAYSAWHKSNAASRSARSSTDQVIQGRFISGRTSMSRKAALRMRRLL